MTAPAAAPAVARVAGGRVALLTPTGRDANVAGDVLRRAGFTPVPCADMAALCASIDGDLGVVMLAEEALGRAGLARLLETLRAQPAWSDIPLVLLTGDGELSHAMAPGVQALIAAANVTLLERPVRVATLVTALRSAMHARRRQLELRDDLEARQRTEAALRDSELRLRAAVEGEQLARAEVESALVAVEAARQRADEANRAKSDFLAAMSHELRTPLNAIGGYSQLLALGVRGPVTAEQQEDLLRIDRNQRHLLALINDILNFAKIEAGHLEVELAPVPLRELIGGLEPLIAPQLASKGLRYGDASGDCDAVVLTDEDKARQVMLNLLSNAIKFTPSGGAITVDCITGGGVARIVVTDDGTGVPVDKQGAIFEPFVQLERSFANTQEGTGLGLAISRDLARRMGGELTVSNVPERGAAFCLELPLHED